MFFVLMAIYDVKVFGFRVRRSPKREKTNEEPMQKRSLARDMPNEKYFELKKKVKELLISEEKEEKRAERQQRKRRYPSNLILYDY